MTLYSFTVLVLIGFIISLIIGGIILLLPSPTDKILKKYLTNQLNCAIITSESEGNKNMTKRVNKERNNNTTDCEIIKDIFSRGGWDIEETIVDEDTEYPTRIKIHLGGYYGIDIFFKENGEIDED